jgi:GNAT superfamily N-acetyltransferase
MAGRPEIQIRDLCGEQDLPMAARLYHEVLQPSFQPAEMYSWEVFAQGLRPGPGPAMRIAVAVDGEGSPVGGLTAELFPLSGVLLVGYVAVQPGWRGRGIGSLLLTTAGAPWYDDPSVVLALGEVHDPRHVWAGPGEESLARIRFFERVGARVLDVSFVQPSLGLGLKRVPNFLLVVFAVKDAALVATDPPAVDVGVVDTFVREYFHRCEGFHGGTPDSELAGLLADVSRDGGIALLPLDRYTDVGRR